MKPMYCYQCNYKFSNNEDIFDYSNKNYCEDCYYARGTCKFCDGTGEDQVQQTCCGECEGRGEEDSLADEANKYYY
jgi:hypothetical protein